MTRYEALTEEIESCRSRANATDEGNLKTFYTNAAKALEAKRDNMTIEEAGQPV